MFWLISASNPEGSNDSQFLGGYLLRRIGDSALIIETDNGSQFLGGYLRLIAAKLPLSSSQFLGGYLLLVWTSISSREPTLNSLADTCDYSYRYSVVRLNNSQFLGGYLLPTR